MSVQGDLSLFNFLVDQLKRHLTVYHFVEIETSLREQGKFFDSAVIAKLALDANVELSPLKVYSQALCAEDLQITMGVIGAGAVSYDVQTIKMLDRFFHERLLLNNYALLINFLGCADDQIAYEKVFNKFLRSDKAVGLCSSCKEKNSVAIFTCANEQCKNIMKDAPLPLNNLCEHCQEEWDQFQEQLELLSVSSVWSPTFFPQQIGCSKVVFEFIAINHGKRTVFCQGCRYKVAYIEQGDDALPLGMKLFVHQLLWLIEPLREKLPLPEKPILHVIMPMTKKQQTLAMFLAEMLAVHNLCVETFLEDCPLEDMLHTANKLGASYCLIVGDREQQAKTVTVRRLQTGVEEQVPQLDIVAYLKR